MTIVEIYLAIFANILFLKKNTHLCSVDIHRYFHQEPGNSTSFYISDMNSVQLFTETPLSVRCLYHNYICKMLPHNCMWFGPRLGIISRIIVLLVLLDELAASSLKVVGERNTRYWTEYSCFSKIIMLLAAFNLLG